MTPEQWANRIVKALDAARAASSWDHPVHEEALIKAAIEDILDEGRNKRVCPHCGKQP